MTSACTFSRSGEVQARPRGAECGAGDRRRRRARAAASRRAQLLRSRTIPSNSTISRRCAGRRARYSELPLDKPTSSARSRSLPGHHARPARRSRGCGRARGEGLHHAYGHAEGVLLIRTTWRWRCALRREGCGARGGGDLDVHQGNGTAQYLRDEPRGLHARSTRKGTTLTPSERGDLDVGLAGRHRRRGLPALNWTPCSGACSAPAGSRALSVGADPYRRPIALSSRSRLGEARCAGGSRVAPNEASRSWLLGGGYARRPR